VLKIYSCIRIGRKENKVARKIIGTASTWREAFKKAEELLIEDRLTAIAVISKEEHRGGSFVATVLKEFETQMGCIDAVVANLERMSPMLYGEHHSFQLVHGEFVSNHPMSSGRDWLLEIIYD
jgi:hypothetical protein